MFSVRKEKVEKSTNNNCVVICSFLTRTLYTFSSLPTFSLSTQFLESVYHTAGGGGSESTKKYN
jgi:hypothetical protein